MKILGQVVNWVKTKPGLAGNQIPFGVWFY